MVWGWFSLTGANRLHTGKPAYPLLTTPTPNNHPILFPDIPLPLPDTLSPSPSPHLPYLLILNSFQDPSRSNPCTTVIQHDTGRAAQSDRKPGNLHHSNPSSVAEPVDSPRFPRQTIRMTDEQIELRPANENPWYVLATYYGEQTGDRIDEDLHAKNREVWNRWMAAALSNEDRQELIDEERATEAELRPFSAEERRKLWADCRSPGLFAPPPATSISLDNTVFANSVSFDHFILPARAIFILSEFQRNADFQHAAFQRNAFFQHATFHRNAYFRHSAFQRRAYFRHVTYQGDAHFWHSAFQRGTDFRHSAFQGDADFQHATFQRSTDFRHVGFQGYALFLYAGFQRDADFEHAAFQRGADFRHTAFQARAGFRHAAFQGGAVFQHAAFQGNAVFAHAKFRGNAVFNDSATSEDTAKFRPFAGFVNFDNVTFSGSADFTNREFLDKTNFNNAKFLNRAPIFADTSLHEGTTWHDVQWPQTPDYPIAARDMADAYSHLRRRSNAIQDHEAELDFYGRELRAKRAAVGGATGLLISLYEWSCGFGASVGLPFFWLLGLWTGMAPVYHLILQHAGRVGIDPMQIYGFSLASLGGFFGMRKEFFGHFTEDLPAMAQTISGAQSLLGAVFVFLLGLSLRNRFRIK